ncbi:NUDIX domain protein [Limnohabitans sp. 103DPR2]|nr:NUDIX domain protein [Limnohabitans sp. 103DPR2]
MASMASVTRLTVVRMETMDRKVWTPMEITSHIVDTPPRDAATVLMLREGEKGMEVLLLKRHTDSKDLGGAFVFPGGKRDEADGSPTALAALQKDAASLHAQLGESDISMDHAASLFVAALREAREECGLQIQATDLQAWSRWITPRMPSLMSKRFDTRFFLARAPLAQTAVHDNHETTEILWTTPRNALVQYWQGEIVLAPPQIMSLSHLCLFNSVEHVMTEAAQRKPPVIMPEPFDQDGMRVICYPGDPRHPVAHKALPGPTRLQYRNKRFEPDGGLEALLHGPL